MKAEIKQLKPIPVLCVRKRGSYTEAAEAAWSQLMRFTYGNKLMNPETKSYGICHDDPSVTESENIRYVACVSESPSVELDDGIESDVIEGGLYAVFLHKGSYQNLPETYAAIYRQWLGESDYQLRDLPPFERYLNRDPRKTKPENLKTEIYIPVTKKKY